MTSTRLFAVLCFFFPGFLLGMVFQKALTAAAAQSVADPVSTVEAPALVETPAAAPRAVENPASALTRRYPFTFLRVVDGDTVDGEWYIWKDLRKTGRLRLLRVNTPELHPKSGTEAERAAVKEKALAAKTFTENALASAKSITMLTDWQEDAFGRVLASLEYVDNSGAVHDLSGDLLKSGFAVPFVK
jgi:endonuclease YncB( thermonuclease family)